MEDRASLNWINWAFGIGLVVTAVVLWFIFGIMLCGCTEKAPQVSLPADAKQALVVLTGEPRGSLALAIRFERGADGWRHRGGLIPATVGKRGITFRKKEGDKKTPAGAFPLGLKRGYGDGLATARDDVFAITAETSCIEDSASALYNVVLQDRTRERRDWAAADSMLREDQMFSRVVDVRFNTARVPGKGSCIFLHVWQTPGAPTAGCIAMPAAVMDELFGWLSADAHPHVVILDRDEYARQAARPGSGLPPQSVVDWALSAPAVGFSPFEAR